VVPACRYSAVAAIRRPPGVFAVSSRAIRDLPYALPLAGVLALLAWLAAPAPSPDAAAAVESLSVPVASPRDARPLPQDTLQADANAAPACESAAGSAAPAAAPPCHPPAGPDPAGADETQAARL